MGKVAGSGDATQGSVRQLDPARLPSGRHHLSREEVARSQRLRLFAAVIAVVGERGWSGTRIADVVDRAGVSRATFYQHFASLDACFAAAFRFGLREFLVELGDVDRAADSGALADRLSVFFERYIAVLTSLDGLPRALHVEMLRSSDEVIDVRRELFDAVARGLECTYDRSREADGLPQRSAEAFDLLFAGLDDLFRERIRTLGAEAALDGIAALAAGLTREMLGLSD